MKKSNLLLIISLLYSLSAFSQFDNNDRSKKPPFDPKDADTVVMVQLSIDFEGNVIDSTVKVVQGVGPGIDAEALRVIRESPKSSPPGGFLRSKKKVYSMTVPVYFHWTDEEENIENKDTIATPAYRLIKEPGSSYQRKLELAEINHQKGLEAYKQAEYTEAITYFKKAIFFEGEIAELNYELFRCYNQLGETDIACNYLKAAKKLKEKYKDRWIDNCKKH